MCWSYGMGIESPKTTPAAVQRKTVRMSWSATPRGFQSCVERLFNMWWGGLSISVGLHSVVVSLMNQHRQGCAGATVWELKAPKRRQPRSRERLCA